MRQVLIVDSLSAWPPIPAATFTSGGMTGRSGFGLIAVHKRAAGVTENWNWRRVVIQNQITPLPPVPPTTFTSGGLVARGGFGSITARQYTTVVHLFSVWWNVTCGSSLQIGYIYFAGDIVVGWVVVCGTEVLFIPEGSFPEINILCGTAVLFFPKVGGLWSIECGTQVNWGVATINRITGLAISCGTTVEFYPENGCVSGPWPIQCGTLVKFFPLLRAVTPNCLTVSEAPPVVGGEIGNYAL